MGLKWNKPPSGNVKFNIDASFYAKDGRWSTGAIIIDGYVVFLAALCSHIPYVTDAHTVESIAMKHGLLIASSLGFNSIQIDFDSTEVKCMCRTGEDIERGNNNLCIMFHHGWGVVRSLHCVREANMVAHTIAIFLMIITFLVMGSMSLQISLWMPLWMM